MRNRLQWLKSHLQGMKLQTAMTQTGEWIVLQFSHSLSVLDV
ncbi:hypothetical protein ACFX2A_028446 [Malus domestica]